MQIDNQYNTFFSPYFSMHSIFNIGGSRLIFRGLMIKGAHTVSANFLHILVNTKTVNSCKMLTLFSKSVFFFRCHLSFITFGFHSNAPQIFFMFEVANTADMVSISLKAATWSCCFHILEKLKKLESNAGIQKESRY